jgi:hypothetical protein
MITVADTLNAVDYDSYLELLPALRAAHPNEYVAVSAGRVLAHGPHLDAVAKRARETGESFYCGWVASSEGGTVIQFNSPVVVEELGAP